VTDFTPPPPPSSGTVSPNRTIMIILSYLGLLALIPLLVEKDDKEVQWHAKHGLVLTVAWFILWMGLFVLQFALAAVTDGAGGCIIAMVMPLIGLGFFIFIIICMVKGINGQRVKIPGISDFADKF
jgi:uncharacterized membrane protein